MSVRSERRAQQREIAAHHGMTLKQLREAQPSRDRHAAIFQPTALASQKPYSPWPQTLDELKERCHDFGIAAVTECQWNCVERWLMDVGSSDLSYPVRETFTAVSLVRAYDRSLLAFPTLDDQPPKEPIYFRLSDEEQEQAALVADAAFRAWDDAGRPHLTSDRVKLIFQVVTTSLGWRNRYPENNTNQDTE